MNRKPSAEKTELKTIKTDFKMTYNAAPLPFQGQKRNFIKKFKEELKQFPNDAIYVDLFGGSGLLSHTIKTEKPNARVIYNDFDNYSERLNNIERTNNLIADIRTILKSVETKKRVPEDLKKQVLKRIKTEEQTGYIDYITVSAALLFSGNYAFCYDDLARQTFYKRVLKGFYKANGYLDGIEVVNKDYKELIKIYEAFDNVIFILDPPYLSTDGTSYTNNNYWKLTDYLNIVKKLYNKRYIYFTSNKSQIVELCHWLGTNFKSNPFEGSTISTTNNRINCNSSYMDIMIIQPKTIRHEISN